MRCMFFAMPLLLSGCYYPYGYYPYGYGNYPYGYYGQSRGAYPYSPHETGQPYYGNVPSYGVGEVHAYGQPTVPDPNNCGTPDQPMACPPLPRHPLPYYPANRQ